MQIKLSLTGASASVSGVPESSHVFDERGGVIGREPGFGWTLPCVRKLVSRKHAVISLEEGTFYLYDGSTNGVFHNDAAAPVGTGGRVALAAGDRLRIGDYTMLVEMPEPALAAEPTAGAEAPAATSCAPVNDSADPPVAAPAVTPEPLSATGATEVVATQASSPFQNRPAPDLGSTEEAWRPPAVRIPEDWDLQVSAPRERADVSPESTVVRALNVLNPPTARALLDGMGLTDRPPAMPEPGPELVGALARALRLALQGAWDLREELDAVHRRATRGRTQPPPPRLAGEDSVSAYLRALLRAEHEAERDRLLFGQHDFIAAMRGRLLGTAECLEQASGAVVEQFAPDKLAGRYRLQQRAGRGLRGLAGRLAGLLAPAGARWRHYRRWYAAQQANGHRAAQQLLEKKFRALYAERAKGPLAPIRR